MIVQIALHLLQYIIFTGFSMFPDQKKTNSYFGQKT